MRLVHPQPHSRGGERAECAGGLRKRAVLFDHYQPVHLADCDRQDVFLWRKQFEIISNNQDRVIGPAANHCDIAIIKTVRRKLE